MRLNSRWISGVVAVVTVACERPVPARSNDTVATPVTPPETTVTPVVLPAPAWDSAAGPVFLVLGPNAGQASLVLPGLDSATALDTVRFDTRPYRTMPLELFRGGRRVGTATVGANVSLDVPDDCSAWPVVSLGGVRDSAGSPPWSVAFRAETFQPLGVDSIADLPHPDSLRLAGELARVASAAPGDTVEALRGIPFVVRHAYRTLLPGGVTVVIAEVERALNQEANPVREHLLLVAEQDSTMVRGFRRGYIERSAGGEDTLESSELLVLGIPGGRTQPVMLVARYLGDGVVYSLIERTSAGTWRLRWSSPYAGC